MAMLMWKTFTTDVGRTSAGAEASYAG